MNGEILNTVMEILFDKCNNSVLLDISRCTVGCPSLTVALMLLHNVFAAIRQHNLFLHYIRYPQMVYDQIYQVRVRGRVDSSPTRSSYFSISSLPPRR